MRKKYEKEDILQVGQELIRQRGYHNTGINDILKASGIPKGSFYNFFESKEAFAKELLEFYGDKLFKVIDSFLSDINYSPLNRLKNFYNWTLETNKEEESRYGCLVMNLSSEVSGYLDYIAVASKAQFDKWINLIAKCIEEGQNLGEIKSTHPPLELAQFIHSSHGGGLMRSKTMRNIEPMKSNLTIIFDLIENK
ncbi:MAG: TetR/AcrR family transcriptional regulator [Bacteroidota bacterium]